MNCLKTIDQTMLINMKQLLCLRQISIDGSTITDRNKAIDHVESKSKASNTSYAVISRAGSQTKSNLTNKNLNDIQRHKDINE